MKVNQKLITDVFLIKKEYELNMELLTQDVYTNLRDTVFFQ